MDKFLSAIQPYKKNIILLAAYLDTIRRVLGDKPMRITSWYRSPNYNKMIGGATRSQHLTGKAVDFSINHLSLPKAYQILDDFHGDKGGLGLYPGHLHIDLRGQKARWKKNKY